MKYVTNTLISLVVGGFALSQASLVTAVTGYEGVSVETIIAVSYVGAGIMIAALITLAAREWGREEEDVEMQWTKKGSLDDSE